MRKNAWLTFTLVMILPVMFLLVSCAKKTVQSQPVQTPQPEVTEIPEVPKAEVASVDVVEPAELRDATIAPEASGVEFDSENIRFAFDSSVLSDQARQILNRNAEYLSTNPTVTVTVEGHCDERGTNDYNMALGERRARSVKDFFVSMGIGADRLNTVSYGEERPIAPGRDEVSWTKNRRAQLVLN